MWYASDENTQKLPFECLPRGFSKIFPNIKAIGFHNTNIHQVSKEDFEEYGDQLIYFRLSKSKVRKIDGDLFMYNKNLLTVGFAENHIVSIDVAAFAPLTKLNNLWLLHNLCVNEDVQSRPDVLRLINDIETNTLCYS